MKTAVDPKKLGKKIKLARVEQDLTQTQLANLIQAKQKSISRYESGLSLPSIETLVKLVKVLKKPAGYFLEETGTGRDWKCPNTTTPNDLEISSIRNQKNHSN